ncbi:ABC transporter ATP-binding protein [Aquabacterium sp. J223]|uniref:ABC transporter ATP-binding protein n=1 Tax=Aquabacterium sp. J223 TaxID=2898431 RepID=UPI0021AD9846|nr:ATP-binding cassette domain-containing protein [Aquabacterium sp. J223]UUX97184.1 ATP-binding cassette domain-containing protein [Aquabacterium sp. J223]
MTSVPAAPIDLRLQRLDKRFGAVTAVAAADLHVRGGEVLALLGENGAGKSTLMKLLYGVLTPDAGSIHVDGAEVRIASPREAMALGIGMVFQQFSLVPALSVRENLALAVPSSPWWLGRRGRRLRALDDHLHTLAPGLDAEASASSLAVGQLQLVELAKVLLSIGSPQGGARQARCVILDEPSAVLTPAEAERLWALIRGLTARGVAVVLITHKLADVRACADRVAVMRAGRVVAQVAAEDATDARIVNWMVGEAPPPVRAPRAPDDRAPVRLALAGVCAGRARQATLEVRAGEIVGVAGVSGSGQTDLAEAVAGLRPLQAGEVILDGTLLRAPRLPSRPTPQLGVIPSEPARNAVAPELSLAVNLALKRLRTLPFMPRRSALLHDADALIARFGVRPADARASARALSGGNLQKLVIARELHDAPVAVVACYPTMGLDVAASAQVYDTLFGLATQGCAVLWVSEDLDDLLRHAHRIAVMFDGRLVTVADASRTSAQALGAWMSGQPASTPVSMKVAA